MEYNFDILVATKQFEIFETLTLVSIYIFTIYQSYNYKISIQIDLSKGI